MKNRLVKFAALLYLNSFDGLEAAFLLGQSASSLYSSRQFTSPAFSNSLGIDIQSRTRNNLLHFNAEASSISGTEGITKPIDELVEKLNDSAYKFRIIVIGNGAILESTSELGPVMKMGISPKTNERLATFADKDKSFEFHLKVDQVSSVMFTSKERPSGGEMRIIRMVADDGKPICSLILQEDGDEVANWWNLIVEEFGAVKSE